MARREKKIFWDYDIKKMDFKNPKVKLWYLNRKLQFGDLTGVKRTDIKRYLNKLDISTSFKELFKNFLKSNG